MSDDKKLTLPRIERPRQFVQREEAGCVKVAS